ncbi:MAG: Macrolide export protein MacA [Pseudomonadota bacterium]
MKFVKWIALAIVVIGLGLGISRALKQRAAKQEAAAQAAAAQLVPPVFDLLASDVLSAKVETVVQTTEVSGSVDAPVRATLKSPVAANVHQWFVQEGEAVKAGQVLGILDNSDLQQRAEQAEQQALAAQAQAQIALRQLESNQSLAQQGFISPIALKASQDNWQAAQSNAKAAQAGVTIARKALQDTSIKAPFDGQVAHVWIKPGDRVAANAPLIDLVNMDQLEVIATVPATQLAHIKIGQAGQLDIEGVARKVDARVARINPALNASNRSATIYLRLNAAPSARAGAFAQGFLEVGHITGVAVPSSAIQTEKPEPYLQVLKDGQINHFPAQALAQGLVDGSPYTVIKDLQPGATILGSTAGTMASGTQVRVISPSPSAQ